MDRATLPLVTGDEAHRRQPGRRALRVDELR